MARHPAYARHLGHDHHVCLSHFTPPSLVHRYARRLGHDHVVLFNYWDAWGIFGGLDRNGFHVPSHRALANVSFGWHETQDAAWGLANHRHVGKCQVALPYVESAACARQSAVALQSAARNTPLFFAGAGVDFDTEAGTTEAGLPRCPNVVKHAKRVRSALLSPALASSLPGAALLSVPHNLRVCNGSAPCEGAHKAAAARHYASSRLCAVAAGDTPSSGRLFDAIACLCVPLLLVDDLQLPFAHAPGAPAAAEYGLNLAAARFLEDPTAAVRAALDAPQRRALETALIATRAALAYRTRRSRVATLALRELWASCVQRTRSSARPREAVAKC